MSLPNIGASEEAVNLMKFALRTGLEGGIIDVKTYLARIAERRAFELHAKERPRHPCE